MTIDSELLRRINDISRDDLTNVHFPPPNLKPCLNSFNFARLTQISNFWEKINNSSKPSLEQSTEDFFSSIYNQRQPFVFIAAGNVNRIDFYYGLSKNIADISSIDYIFHSVFPDIRLDFQTNSLIEVISSVKNSAVLTGIPTSKSNYNQNSENDQIERICRGLYGTLWLYAVYAEPLSFKYINDKRDALTREIKDIHSRYLLKLSATDERNRFALRYVEMLEMQLKRFEKGQLCGMWKANVMVLVEDASTLNKACSLLYGAFSGEKSIPEPIRLHSCSANNVEMPHIEPINNTEVAIIARLPKEEYPGYEIIEYTRFGVSLCEQSSDSASISIGEIYDRGRKTGNKFKLSYNDLSKHALIVGVTGSGKTNTCFEILSQIWKNGQGVPFLVIESAKSEYRSLINDQRFRGLHVFTVGDETISPLRLNPFEVPDNVLVQTHIDYLKSLFSAAFVLYPPMPYVLEQCIHDIYEDRGWNLTSNINVRGEESIRKFPTLSDLAAKIPIVVGRMGYDEKITMDVKAGLLARINQLRIGGGKGQMFTSKKSIDVRVLFEKPCLLELKQIVSDDEKAFIIGLILIRLYEYYEGKLSPETGQLNHVTLIEEAHRLLRNVSMDQGGEVTANPKGKAIEVFANILSEIRAYGEGILIAEQIPTKLTPDAIKNTNLKIIHRLVAKDDREMVGNTMNLDKYQIRKLSTLQTGEAVLYSEGLSKAVFIKVKKSDIEHRILSQSMNIKKIMSNFWDKNSHLFNAMLFCEKCPIKKKYPSVCSINKNEVQDNSLLIESYTRLFNAIRLNRTLILDAYSDFDFACRRLCKTEELTYHIYCLFSILAEKDIERRGEFYLWNHSDIDELIVFISYILSSLCIEYGNVEKKTLLSNIGKKLTSLSNYLKRIHKVNMLPYPACRLCNEPCYYHFDSTYAGTAPNSIIFKDMFFNPDIDIEEVARLCYEITSKSFPINDIRSRRGAALCFCIQQFSDSGFNGNKQIEMAELMSETLVKI